MDRSVRAALEPLENRLLLSSYLISNNQYSKDGGSSITINPGDVIHGTSGVDTFIAQGNMTVNYTIDGAGGADTITINTNTAVSNTTTIEDTGGSNEDTLIIRAPGTAQADLVLNLQSQTITNGSATVNYSADNPSAISLIGQIFSNGDNCIINGTSGADTFNITSTSIALGGSPITINYSTFHSLTVNGGGGADAFNVNSDSIATSLFDGSYNGTTFTPAGGGASFVVNANSQTLAIYGGTATDSFTINNNSGPISINSAIATGGTIGAGNFTVNASSSGMTFTGGAGANVYNVVSNSATLTIIGQGTSNTLNVQANSGTLNVSGGTGTDSFTINANTGSITINGGTGASTYAVTAPPVAAITINGHSGAPGVLTFTGTPLVDAFSITSTTVNAGTGASITYGNLTGLVVNGAGNDDTFLVISDSTPTTINAGSGNDTFNVRANSATGTLQLNPGTGTNTVNIGSNVPATTGNNLAGILGAITFAGGGSDLMNVFDTADATARTLGLTETNSTTGLATIAAASITYSGLATLNFQLGTGGNTLSAKATIAGTTTNITLGTGLNTAIIGDSAASVGLSNIAGALNLTGSGSDPLTVDDSASSAARTFSLSANTLTTTGLGTITYTSFNALSVNLSSGGSTITVTNTNANTPTTINGGNQNDTYTVNNDASALTLNTGGGGDIVNIQSTSATTDINTQGGGTTVYYIGSMAPAVTGGVTSGIQGPITIAGGVDDTVTVDNSADTTANRVGGLTATNISGLGMVAGGITYSGLFNLTINLGSNGNIFTISDTSAITGTNVNGGPGVDTFTVTTNNEPLGINAGGGNDTVTVDNTANTLGVFGDADADTVNIRATGAATSTLVIPGGDSGDAVNISSNAPVAGNLAGILGQITVDGGNTTTLTVDDSTDSSPTTGQLEAGDLIFSVGGAAGEIDFDSLAVLNLNFGSAADSLTIGDTSSTVTNINTGDGTNSLDVQATTNPLDITSGTNSSDSIVVGSSSSVGSGVLSGIQGQVSVAGNGSDILFIDDGGDAIAQTVKLTNATDNSTLPADRYINSDGNWAQVNFTNLGNLLIYLGSDANTATLVNTITGATTLTVGNGDNTITLDADAGTTNITDGTGHNTINILTTSASTSILSNSNIGDSINIGSDEGNADSTLNNIAGPLSITGNDGIFEQVSLYDTGAQNKTAGTLSSTEITGLSPAAITYGNIRNLNIHLGGGDTFTVASTPSGLNATLDASTANTADEFDIQSIAGNTTILTNAFGDHVNVSTTAPTPGGSAQQINANLTVTGSAGTVLNVDDSADATGQTVNISSGQISLGNAPIFYTNTPTVNIELGSGDDIVTITSTEGLTPAASYSINTGPGADVVNVENLTDNLAIDTGSGGADTINLSSSGSSPGGVVSTIANPITITGHGADTLNISDGGDGNATTTNLTATQIQTLLPTITYTGLAALNFQLGNHGNTFNITSSALGTVTTVNTGLGANTTNIGSQAPTNTGGTFQAMAGQILITGQGTDALNLDNSGESNGGTETLSATAATFAGSVVDYSDIHMLNIQLAAVNPNFTVTGTGANTFVTTGSVSSSINVQATNSPLTFINNAGGVDTDIIGSTAPTSVGTLQSILGAISFTGSGFDSLTLDDSGDTTGRTVTLSATSETGASPAAINYGPLASLNLSLGSGDDTLNILSTIAVNAPLDVIVIGQTAPDVPAPPIPTNVNTGNGNDTVNIESTESSLTLTTGNGTDTVNISSTAPQLAGTVDNIGALVNVQGGGQTTLNLDDSASTENKSTSLNVGGEIFDLAPGQIDYSGLSNLNIQLGSGVQTVAVGATDAGTSTVITAGSGNDSFTFNDPNPNLLNIIPLTSSLSSIIGAPPDLSQGLAGPITVDGAGGTNSLAVDDSGEPSGTNIVIAPTTITGIGAGITYLNFSSVDLTLSQGSSLTVNGTNPDISLTAASSDLSSTYPVNLNYPADFTGTLSLSDVSGGTIAIGGSLLGNLSIDGALDSMTIGQNLTGDFSITGDLGSMAIAGNDSGSITVGSVGTISVAQATASGSNGTLFSLTQNGVYRSINATGSTSGLTANIFYEGDTLFNPGGPIGGPTPDIIASLPPQAALTLTNADPSQSFDLTLTSAGDTAFNLSRIDSGSGAKSGLFNLAINGSLLSSIDTATSTYFSYAAGTGAGVDLPLDHLGLISVSQNLPSNSIIASSIQGIAFATLTLPNGSNQPASSITANLLPNVLVINPNTKKPYTQVVMPGKTPLLVMLSPAATTPVGVFTGVGKKGTKFVSNNLYFTDQNTDSSATLMAQVSFAGKKTVSNIAFQGDGGTIDTTSKVNNISSDGWVGDVLLEGGHAKLQSLTAKSIHGNVNLFGGQLIGELQTTDGDVGAADATSGNSTVLHVAMGKSASIVVRGNLLSKVNIDNSLAGTIAASGDIGAYNPNNRPGGINIGGSDSGQIISLGNIIASINIAGNLSGRIAAQGVPIDGLNPDQQGILGGVIIGQTLAKTAAIVSNGEIGDNSLGTKVTVKSDKGLVAAGGTATVTSDSTGGSAATIANANKDSANQAVLLGVWTDNGVTLGIDSSVGALDQAGLKLIQGDLANLKASNGKLSGTVA